MLTPQEVAEHSFGKASFSGYNMAAVDDFLDEVTADYETLYNDNTLLKQKLGVLSGKIREYQSTEEAMRKTLLTAQKMADDMVKEAEGKKADLVRDAEAEARARIAGLKEEVTTEEMRLTAARNATAAYVAQLKKLTDEQTRYIDHLDQLMPPAPVRAEATVDDIEQAVLRAVAKESVQAEEPAVQEAPAPQGEDDGGLYEDILAQASIPQEEPDPDATRRIDKFSDLGSNFGRDYELK